MRIAGAFVGVSIIACGALPSAHGQALRGASSPVNAAAEVADKLAGSPLNAHAEGDKAVSSGGWYFSPSSSSHYDNWMKVPDGNTPVTKEESTAPVNDKAVASGGWYFSPSSSSHYNNWRVLEAKAEEEQHNLPTVSAAEGSKDGTTKRVDTKQAQPTASGGDKAVASGGWYFSPSSSSHYDNW